MEQRRSDPRYERQLDVEIVYAGQQFLARTSNISVGGMQVASDRLLLPGAEVHLSFFVPTQNEEIEVPGLVRWCSPNGDCFAAGIRFNGLRARDVWALNRLFSTVEP